MNEFESVLQHRQLWVLQPNHDPNFDYEWDIRPLKGVELGESIAAFTFGGSSLVAKLCAMAPQIAYQLANVTAALRDVATQDQIAVLNGAQDLIQQIAEAEREHYGVK